MSANLGTEGEAVTVSDGSSHPSAPGGAPFDDFRWVAATKTTRQSDSTDSLKTSMKTNGTKKTTKGTRPTRKKKMIVMETGKTPQSVDDLHRSLVHSTQQQRRSTSTNQLNTMLSTFRHKKALLEVTRRRGRQETYTEPLLSKDGPKKSKEDLEEIKQFLFTFYKTIYKRRPELNAILEQYPNTVGRYYTQLVPSQVTFEDFWQRYFFRCDEDRIIRELERQYEASRQAQAQAISGGVESVKNLWHSMTEEAPQKVDDLKSKKPGDVATPSDEEAKGSKAGGSSKSPPIPQRSLPQSKRESPIKKQSSEEITFDDLDQKPTVVKPAPAQKSRGFWSAKSETAPPPQASKKEPVSPSTKGKPRLETKPKSGSAKKQRVQEPQVKNVHKPNRGSISKTPPNTRAASLSSDDADETAEVTMKERAMLFKNNLFEKTRALSPKSSSVSEEPSQKASSKTKSTVSSASKSDETDKSHKEYGRTAMLVVSVVAVVAAVVAGLIQQEVLVSVDSLCSPVRPGRILGGSEEDLSLEAPWWLPSLLNSQKPRVFEVVCGNRVRTRLDWTLLGHQKQQQPRGDDNSKKPAPITTIHKLTLLKLNRDDTATRIFEKQQLSKATMQSKKITLQDKKGTFQDMVGPWILREQEGPRNQ